MPAREYCSSCVWDAIKMRPIGRQFCKLIATSNFMPAGTGYPEFVLPDGSGVSKKYLAWSPVARHWFGDV